MVFKGWYLEPTYETRVDDEYVIYGSTRVFAKFTMINTGTQGNTVLETTFTSQDILHEELNDYPSNDDVTTTFNYTGSEQTFQASKSGIYKVEVWGAQGGINGGKGSYTSGIISLSKNERGETMCKSEKKIKDLMAPHVDSEGEGGGN